MRVFRDQEPDHGRDAATFALGALGGLAIGMLLSRRVAPPRVEGIAGELRSRVEAARERARSAARRLQPARLRRMAGEQAELTELEDRVLDAFLADSLLSERGIDVGAISPGILELSGSVWTEEEAHRAVRLANTIPGVRTVVNRMEIEDARRGARRGADAQWQGRVVGTGLRRQGRETEPNRPDDAQIQKDEALRESDMEQWQDEGISWEQPHLAERPEVRSSWRTEYDEDELDNQDPHGKHGTRTLDEQPQEMNASARVGEGLKTGTHLRLEQEDLPAKPHREGMETEGEDADRGTEE